MAYGSEDDVLGEVDGPNSEFKFMDSVVGYLEQESTYEYSNCVIGNLLMVHLAWNREGQTQKYFSRFRELVCENGLFKKTPVMV